MFYRVSCLFCTLTVFHIILPTFAFLLSFCIQRFGFCFHLNAYFGHNEFCHFSEACGFFLRLFNSYCMNFNRIKLQEKQENKQTNIYTNNSQLIYRYYLFTPFILPLKDRRKLPSAGLCDKKKNVGNREGKWYKLEDEMKCYLQHKVAMNETVKYEFSLCLNIFWVLYSTQSLLGFSSFNCNFVKIIHLISFYKIFLKANEIPESLQEL